MDFSIIKKKTEELNIGKILSQLESNAWYGGNTTAYLLTDKDIIILNAYTYEPTYENFSTAHSIEFNNEWLFFIKIVVMLEHITMKNIQKVSLKTSEEAINYLKNICEIKK